MRISNLSGSLAFVSLARTAVCWNLPQFPLAEPAQTWNPVKLDDRICKSGSEQYAGTIKISETKKIFYWLAESRHDSANSPTIVWLNGGPGASSLSGLFTELGPCDLDEKKDETTLNPDSWVNFANVIFVDQPVGVGFSTVVNKSYPTTLSAASVDFLKFLKELETQAPQYFQSGFYIAGESFGGQFVPKYAADLVQQQEDGAADALKTKLNGIILVDALMDGVYSFLGHYDLFCMPSAATPYLSYNETTCNEIQAAMPECSRLGNICRTTNDPYVCLAAQNYCYETIYRFFTEEMLAGRHNPYDLREKCTNPPLCIPIQESRTERYLNNPDIQKLLQLGEHIHFEAINFELNFAWGAKASTQLPSTQNTVYLLDESDVRVLVINGNLDIIVNSPGIILELNELPWHRQAEFRAQKMDNWDWKDSEGNVHQGGQVKGIDRLQFIGVDDAGHMCPGDQKAAVASVVDRWLANESL